MEHKMPDKLVRADEWNEYICLALVEINKNLTEVIKLLKPEEKKVEPVKKEVKKTTKK